MSADGPRLDAVTLFLAISMFGFFTAGIAASARHAAPAQSRALLTWSHAMLAAGVAFLLFFLRGHAPWWLTFVVGNVLVVLIPALAVEAHARLFGRTVNAAFVGAVLAFGFGGIFAVQVLDAPVQFGIAMLSAAGSVLLGMSVLLLAREAFTRRLPAAAFGSAVAALTCIGFGARAIVSLVGDPAAVAPTSGSSAQVGPLLLGTLFVVGSSMAFLAMVHALQRADLLERAGRDGLTGVHTRAAFFEQAAAHERMFPAEGLAVVMLDVDHFKAVNDGFGHRGGDLTLANVARHIAGAVRITDIVGRYGGEEFCVLLPACTEADAALLASRIVAQARAQQVRLDDGRTVNYTLSAGYAASGGAGGQRESLADLIERADQALYRAKRSGRDRALAAHEPALPAGGAVA